MILVTGSLAYDYIMNFPGSFGDHILPEKIHVLNLSFMVETLRKSFGGTAGNIAYTLALLGEKPAVLGYAGEDFSEYDKFLRKAGVDTTLIRINVAKSTASAFVMTDQNDNQITGFYPGAITENKDLRFKNIDLKIDDFVVISPDDPDAMINYARECQKLKLKYLFDPGMQLPRLPDEDLKLGVMGAEVLIGNDYEMSLIKSRLWMENDDLLKHAKVLITTLGEKGAEILTKDSKIMIDAAKPNEVLDPTGAGDCFRAGFLAGYLKGFDLKTCGQMGAVASCYTVEKYGTTTHSFTIPEFEARYRENYNEGLDL